MPGSNDLLYNPNTTPKFRIYVNGTFPIASWERDWTGRLLDIDSGLGYTIEDWTGRFKVSQLSFAIADPDRKIWDTFYGSSGTFPLASHIQLQVAMTDGVDISDYYNLFTGRVTNFKTSKAEVVFSAQNAMRSLADAYFVWDYHNIPANEGSGAFGKVIAVNGSTVYFLDSQATTITNYLIEANPNLPKNWEISHYRKYYSVIRGGQLAGGIFEGDVLKFHGSSVSDTNAASFLANFPSYTVRFGTVMNRVGTLELNKAPADIAIGHNIYRRVDLVYSGNPGDIVWRILTGSNTNVNFDDTASSANVDIDYNTWNKSKKALIPMSFIKLIEPKENEQVKVTDELNELLESCMAYIWFNQDGKLFFKTFSPQDVTLSVGTNYHFTGSGNIIGDDFEHSSDWDDVANVVEFYYDYIPGVEQDQQFQGYTSKKDSAAAGRYGSQEKTKVIHSKWIHNDNEAVVMRDRYLSKHKYGIPYVSWTTAMNGLDINLATTVQVTHPEGSLTNRKVFLTEKTLNPLECQIKFMGWDFNSLFGGKGYAFWMTGSGTLSVSGTSRAGWGTLGTVHNIDTQIGTIFKWW